LYRGKLKVLEATSSKDYKVYQHRNVGMAHNVAAVLGH
jgi:hypothetical protein